MNGEAQVLPREPLCLLSAFTGIDLSLKSPSCESQWADQSHAKLLIQSVCPRPARWKQNDTVKVQRVHTKQMFLLRHTIKGVNN